VKAKSPTTSLTLLEVTWLDAGVVGLGEWLTREQVDADATPGNFINHTVGWLVREDETAIVIAAQLAPKKDEKDCEFDLCMFIPKVLIKKRRVIKL
jgi:hypothetical protein